MTELRRGSQNNSILFVTTRYYSDHLTQSAATKPGVFMNNVANILNDSTEEPLEAILSSQKAAFRLAPMPSAQDRIRSLDKLNNAVIDYADRLIEAINDDFGTRSKAETQLAEIYPVLDGLAYARKRVKRWMKPERRGTPLILLPASVKVVYQPVGVVGIVVPWNFPVFLGLSPLIMALAAGNRAMVKTSEHAPQTSAVIKKMLQSCFDESEVAVVEGDVSVSTAFTKLPFDHLIFTGATNVGRMVMRAAAENLTPVTLELGGKSPAIIHDSFPVKEAAKRLAFGKAMNAGQICVSPDYVFCPEGKLNEFIAEFKKQIATRYPTLRANEDFTAIINDRQLERLKSYLEDAQSKGAQLLTINPADEDLASTGKLPLTLVLGAIDDMLVMQEEIFGPILPVLTYRNIAEVTEYVNARPRPLALYYFDWDRDRSQAMLETTHSGGACINDTLSHVMADDIPFGGIGDSGMGNYHGREGFRSLSKAKGVVRKGKFDATMMVGAPWDRFIFNSMIFMQRLRFRKRSL